tara:strand:+ start:75 stop:269 length:195 start_codon:yes stop_codon:yes gene_type:complete
MKTKKSSRMIKGVNVSSLNKRQQDAMARHSKHHTIKHLKVMVGAMNKGATFGESHKLAMKKVGV